VEASGGKKEEYQCRSAISDCGQEVFGGTTGSGRQGPDIRDVLGGARK